MIPVLPPIVPADALPNEPALLTASQRKVWRFHAEHVLGTRLDVLVTTDSALLAKRAADAARAEIRRLDRVFNHRVADSELSTLNRTRRASVGAELFAVVKLSETWRGITHGAFDGRMGELLRLWAGGTPSEAAIDLALNALRAAAVIMDPVTRWIELTSTSELSLDAIAKGHIVDAALNAASAAAPGIEGLAIDIGGDVRCWGHSPWSGGWRVGIPEASRPADNAPLVDVIRLQNAAIATSGRGPRDCVGDRYRSTTISPLTGHPVHEVISASVVASHAADADALATACLVMPPTESLALVDRLGVAARITDQHGEVHLSREWPKIQLAAATASQQLAAVSTPSLPEAVRWPADWELKFVYQAPDRNESERGADFRTQYMALWVTDAQNRRVRTIVMVGTDPQWQRDNFIWWTMHRDRAKELIDLRSQATALSGRYAIFWNGVDDDWKPVPLGKYTLHLETSQERGKHNYRSITIDLGRERFKTMLENLPDTGGIEISYGHYNDRFKNE